MNLTHTEQLTEELIAIGKSAKEGADILEISVHTFNTHVRNLKAKRGLQKASEIAGNYWCRIAQIDFDKAKEQVVKGAKKGTKQTSKVLAICILLIGFSAQQNIRRVNFRQTTRTTATRVTTTRYR